MPIYMDVHIVPGVKAKDVAEAHSKDLLHQSEYECTCMTYWVDEKRESIFCLIEAPDKKAVEEMHNRAHGLIPNKVIEVNSSVVEAFLGRIYDPENAVTTDDGLKVFADPSFRILLLIQIEDPVLLNYRLGTKEASQLTQQFNQLVRQNIHQHNGREAQYHGNDFIISFSSAKEAVVCSLAIQNSLIADEKKTPFFKMGLSAGEPIANKNSLFGDVIEKARNITAIVQENQLILSSTVKELVAKEDRLPKKNNIIALTPQDERTIDMLFSALEENWQSPEFDITAYCQSINMSKSQLYRKTVSLTGLSPNLLLKDYRLQKAKELMKKQQYSIAQVTYEAGFTSPSYFTKCFKKKYNLLPMEYLDLLNSSTAE